MNEKAFDVETIQSHSKPFTRRDFLTTSTKAAVAAGAMVGWFKSSQISVAQAKELVARGTLSVTSPPLFPPDVPLYLQSFQNWSGEIYIDRIWTCSPKTADEVVTIVNWARSVKFQVRPKGHCHNWSPLSVTANPQSPMTVPGVLMVDFKDYLTQVSTQSETVPPTVTAQTGVAMEDLLLQLENAGLGLTAHPAPGDITLGGALAINGHGTGIPMNGETILPGDTFGSLSNRVLSLTAVVYDQASDAYILKTFSRSDAECQYFLTHLGRSLIVEVTLQAAANRRVRCQSSVDVPVGELFGPTSATARTFANYVESTGRAEAIWFPFSDCPWLKVWSICPEQPQGSQHVTEPYNYSFSDNISSTEASLIGSILSGSGWLTPTMGKVQYEAVKLGLWSSGTADLWGWASNLFLYIKPTTLRVTANGYAIVTNRQNIQRVVNEFFVFYSSLMDQYNAQNAYPINGPIEIRVTGLDHVEEVINVTNAQTPTLSALRPDPNHPDWDVAIWLDILTVPNTPNSMQFYQDLEQWILMNYSGDYAVARPEWSKGWGYANNAAWNNDEMISNYIPKLYNIDTNIENNWDAAFATYDKYDPEHLFSSVLLDRLSTAQV